MQLHQAYKKCIEENFWTAANQGHLMPLIRKLNLEPKQLVLCILVPDTLLKLKKLQLKGYKLLNFKLIFGGQVLLLIFKSIIFIFIIKCLRIDRTGEELAKSKAKIHS